MRSLPLHRIAAWLFGACLMTSLPAHADLLPERVRQAVQERVADGAYPTIVFGMVDGDKTEVVTFGTLGGGKAPDGDTVYEIGSITKTVTATILARAVLAGRVTLDMPVAQLLPDFKIPSRSGKEVTLGTLAMNHSGLPGMPSNFLPKDPSNPYADYDADKLKAFLASLELSRDPGASYEYSNVGFGLLGHALAQSERTTYEALIRDAILAPLGMTMSSIALTDDMRARLAPPHDAMGRPAHNWDLDALEGAGGIRSTANDMLRYLKANMGLASSPLDAAMTLAHQPRLGVGPHGRIGLAWMTNAKGIVWHTGGTGGYASFLGFTADRRRGVIILTNTSVNLAELGMATLDAEAPVFPMGKAITLPAASLDEYVGSYKLNDKFFITVVRVNDALLTRGTGQAAFPIFPSAPNEFFAKINGIRLSFTRDPAGAVAGLVLHQNGDHPAPKVAAAPTEIQLDARTLGDYVGKYKFDFGGVLDVALRSDNIEAQLSGQPAFPIYATAKDRFFYKVVDAQLDFERDPDGRVTSVILHQNGKDLRAPRIPAE